MLFIGMVSFSETMRDYSGELDIVPSPRSREMNAMLVRYRSCDAVEAFMPLREII